MMFKERKRRRELHDNWNLVVRRLTMLPIDSPVSDSDLEWIADIIAKSVDRYASGSCLYKKTFKLLGVAKRVLGDKRHFDVLKALDYLIACHNVSRYTREMVNDVRKQAIAYLCCMSIRYLQIVREKKASNPFHAGQIFERINNERS